MSLQMDLSADVLDEQMQKLANFDVLADQYYRESLTRDVRILYDLVEPQIPNRTGNMLSSFRSRVMGTGMSLQGEVGWWGKAPFYARFLEDGTKDHSIAPRGGRITWAMYATGGKTGASEAIRYPGGGQGGDYTFRRGSYQVKGVSKRGFMSSAWDTAGPLVEQDLQLASQEILNQMQVNNG